MSEEDIKKLMHDLSQLTYYSNTSNYSFNVIDKENLILVEQVIRKYLLDTHDSELGYLKAKVIAYESIIKNSNFKPILEGDNCETTK